jgi:hypothetical protein
MEHMLAPQAGQKDRHEILLFSDDSYLILII